jgi:hypothetical protein
VSTSETSANLCVGYALCVVSIFLSYVPQIHAFSEKLYFILFLFYYFCLFSFDTTFFIKRIKNEIFGKRTFKRKGKNKKERGKKGRKKEIEKVTKPDKFTFSTTTTIKSNIHDNNT